MIKFHTSITCPKCGKDIPIGEYAYEFKTDCVCESCADSILEQMKEDAKIEVNNSNFDLEEEY